MSEAEVEDEQPEEVEEVAEQAEQQADGDQPSMSTEEMADLDAIAEEVEADTAPDPDGGEAESSTNDDASEDPDTEESSGGSIDTSGDGSNNWGDMYVGTLTTVSNALIEEHGLEDADPIDESLARDLHLDEYFDEWMSQRGKADMPPEQGVLIGSTMFLVAVIGTKTDIPSQLLDEVDF